MRKLFTCAAALASVFALVGAPQFAAAQPDHHRPYHRSYAAARHAQSCHNARRRRANNGTLIGGAGGALAGGAIGHGLGGALIGGAVGAVAGHSIADRRKGDC